MLFIYHSFRFNFSWISSHEPIFHVFISSVDWMCWNKLCNLLFLTLQSFHRRNCNICYIFHVSQIWWNSFAIQVDGSKEITTTTTNIVIINPYAVNREWPLLFSRQLNGWNTQIHIHVWFSMSHLYSHHACRF